MAGPPTTVEEALAFQAAASVTNGSPLYAALLTGLLADYRAGGITARHLDGVSAKPWSDAVALRYVATGHRLALAGAAPRLARHYPSCLGSWDGGDDVIDDFLAIVAANPDEFSAGMRRNVQTNEVGRAAVLASGFATIAGRHGPVLDMIEIGSSAGLLSRWDHFHYDTGHGDFGDTSSHLRFEPGWWVEGHPTITVVPQVRTRAAVDIAPVDIGTHDGRLTMMSFVWPDQLLRIERLRAALEIAALYPMTVESADAGAWLTGRLADGPHLGAATVVYHSIVWQYLPHETKAAVRAALAHGGSLATDTAPLLWLRMEPAGTDHADLRLTTWPGGGEEELAHVGYHGAGIRWLAGG